MINLNNDILDYLAGETPMDEVDFIAMEEQDEQMLSEQWAEAANSWISAGGNPQDARRAADQMMRG